LAKAKGLISVPKTIEQVKHASPSSHAVVPAAPPRGPPMKIDFLEPGAPGWQDAAALIEGHFRASFEAEIRVAQVELATISTSGGRLVGAAGLRDAERGFFSEVYLEQPVETLLSRMSGVPVSREEIIEVVSLACPSRRATLPLVDAITAEGRRRGMTWGLFTATAPLMALLRRAEAPLLALAEAAPERLVEARNWGRYYETAPWVCALRDARQSLRFMPARAIPRIEEEPRCI
jgi:hypothetical protein